MRRSFAGFWAAWRFLTRVPLPGWVGGRRHDLHAALPWFPLVGLLLGGVVAAADTWLRLLFAPLAASVLVVALLLGLSGALHADGLVDTADAVLAHATPERRLAIMRDPHVGAFGVVALVVVFATKVAAVEALPPELRTGALLLAPTLGRWAIVLQAAAFPYGRPSGLGAALKAGASGRTVLAASLLPAALALLLGPWAIGLALAAGLLALLLGRWLMRLLPGLTGDCYGATCEVVEAVCLLLAAPMAAALSGASR